MAVPTDSTWSTYWEYTSAGDATMGSGTMDAATGGVHVHYVGGTYSVECEYTDTAGNSHKHQLAARQVDEDGEALPAHILKQIARQLAWEGIWWVMQQHLGEDASSLAALMALSRCAWIFMKIALDMEWQQSSVRLFIEEMAEAGSAHLSEFLGV